MGRKKIFRVATHHFPGNQQVVNSCPLAQQGTITAILSNTPLVELHQLLRVVMADVIMRKRLEDDVDVCASLRNLSATDYNLAGLRRLG